ncbi:MAG TPA: hypothetical protein VHZ29_07325 [Rhizomicrobium sp.]|jgi:hypothetical protein|nr:hypothetical protein [Rhizomicrobium sp.]
MTVSRTSLAVLAAVLIATGAQAQTGDSGSATAPPRMLGRPLPPVEQAPAPDQEPPAASSDTDQAPDVDTSDLKSDLPEPARTPQARPGKQPPPVEAAPLAPPEPPKPSVQVETLGTVEGPAEGLLDPSNGGMDENIWSGSQRADIETMLPHLPLSSPDTAIRGLSKKLILTKADAPAGAIKRPLITIRIEKLLDAGLTDEAAALAASASVKDDPDFARIQADAILSAGRTQDACGNATSSRLSEGSQFWLQLRAYCAAAAGDSATAEITRNILDAQQLGDPAYNTLIDDVLTKAKKPPGTIAKPTTMHLFLLRRAGIPVSAEIAKHLGTGANLLALRDQRNPPEARLAAAERVVKTGAATAAELKAVLDAQTMAPDRLAGAQAAAAKLPFLAGQALLRRAALLESRPPAKAQLVHQALLLGEKAGLFETAARLQADVIEKTDAASVPSDQAPLLGWALLIAGKHDAASRWLSGGDAPRAVLALVSGKEASPADLSSIARDENAPPKALNPNQPYEGLLLGAYDALGLAMPADARGAGAKHWPGRRPDADAMQKIVEASSAPDRRGEAVLRILNFIGTAGPRDVAPDVTIEFLHALQDMGLKDSARALAIHALLLYRPSAP